MAREFVRDSVFAASCDGGKGSDDLPATLKGVLVYLDHFFVYRKNVFAKNCKHEPLLSSHSALVSSKYIAVAQLSHLVWFTQIFFRLQRVPRLRNARNQDLLSFSRGATVQLATPTSCLVVHLVRPDGRHSNMCAPILKSVLEDETYVKAGCALDDDLVGLYELWGNLDAKSRFDLGTVVPCTNGTEKHRGRNRSGLQSLSKSILGVNLPKDRGDVQSDWSDVPLSDARIVYAARDAWAGAAISNKLAEYDPECFSREALVNLFRQMETPISNLVKRRRKRRRAKENLELLLHPFKDETSERLPRQVQQKAKRLRELINTRVIDHHVVFETVYLEDDDDRPYR